VRLRGEGRIRAALLFLLVLLLPFEPRWPTLAVLGTRITLLELAAALLLPSLAIASRERIFALACRPTAPLLLIALYAAAHLISAALAPREVSGAARFALRMLAMAGCAWVVAALPGRARRAGMAALAASAAVVAMLGIAEGMGLRALDPFLALFRQSFVNVGGVRRATAGTEYPNLAAAFMAYGLVAGAGFARQDRLGRGTAFAALVSLGMLCTYSRAGLLAAGVGLVALVMARRAGGARAPLAMLAVLIVCAAAFAVRGGSFGLRLTTEGTDRWYAARYAPSEPTLRLAPGEVRSTRVGVINDGRMAWTAREGFHLSHHWYGLDDQAVWDGSRTALPGDVAPGDGVQLDAELRAPLREGRYLLLWDMVHEHTTWFREQGVVPAVVPVVVSTQPAAPLEATGPRADVPGLSLEPRWQPGRLQLWTLALQLWRERPVTGYGPDSFRHLYGPKAGRAAWDARVFANSLYLEAAATTGILGLLAIVGTLLASARAALVRARAAPPGSRDAVLGATTLALVAVIAVHGVLDYVLAFTGQYLAFAFVVGAAGAPGEEAV
jgi:hypothetical protein